MTKPAKQVSRRKRPWLFALFSVLSSVTIVLLIVWKIGLDPFKRQHATATKPIPVAEVSAHSPSNAIEINPRAPKGNDSSVSPAPLKLTLVQVHLGRNATEGSAEIGVVRESPQTYLAGAVLENGARLAEVHADYVLLQKNGRSDRLYLDGAKSAHTRDSALAMVGGNQTPAAAPITSHETLTDYLRPSPKFDGTELMGLEVYPGKNSAVFWQMGLNSGDVITAIDGAPVRDAVFALEQLRSLVEGSAVTVTITRGQDSQSLALDGSYVLSNQAQRANLASSAAIPAPPGASP